VSIREKVTNGAHGFFCGGEVSPDNGCCGCGTPTADVSIAACGHCGKAYETYCWVCVDTWPADVALPVYVVFPGHERV
jgi:hypothetical protein